MKKIAFLVFVFAAIAVNSQPFLRNTSKRALTFKEIQLQFNDFKHKNDLRTKKHWKNFKRWEFETQLHTNTQGEPDGYRDYIDAALEMAEYKNEMQSKAAAASWSPSGPNVLPNNLTGYMENGIGRFNCVAFHPTNANTFFAVSLQADYGKQPMAEPAGPLSQIIYR
jgi:hypothetical protein